MIWIIAFSILFSSVLTQCPIYNCTDFNNTDEKKFTCKKMNDEVFNLQACPKPSLFCDLHYDTEEDICRESYSKPLKYPGEHCHTAAECYSKSCNNKTEGGPTVCLGWWINNNCTSDIDCDNTLYCNKEARRCLPWSKIDEECGISGKKCGPNGICGTNNRCILIGSLDNGNVTTAPRACKSQYMHEGLCQQGPKLKRTADDPQAGPIECPKETKKCIYTFTSMSGETSEIEEDCECGRTENPQGLYCNPGVGDIDFSDYLSYVQNKDNDCHISKGPLCMNKNEHNMSKSYFKAYVAYVRSTSWVLYHNNSPCVKAVMNRNYWYAVNRTALETDNYESISLAFLFLLGGTSCAILLVILFFVYLAKKKSMEEQTKESLLAVN